MSRPVRCAPLQSRSVSPPVAAWATLGGWLNLLVPLVFEYELTLRRASTGGTSSGSDIESVVHFLCANANLRLIFFLWRPFLPDPKDDFVLELAIESRADWPSKAGLIS